jgi:hypothetical protein
MKFLPFADDCIVTGLAAIALCGAPAMAGLIVPRFRSGTLSNCAAPVAAGPAIRYAAEDNNS